jgi:prolyl-tRNA synthetase
MGSYGIGVERAIAVIAEVHHDDSGLVWPAQVAPAEVNVLALSVTDEAVRRTAEDLYATLQTAGLDALLDDRDVRPGVKFKDSELIGIPVRVSVGARDLAEGVVEVTSRATGEKDRVPLSGVTARVRELLAAQRR